MKTVFNKKNFKKYASDKRIQWSIIAVLFLFIIIFSSSIRLSNIHLLEDVTTGKNIPLALDPFYFLRLAETIVEQGSLPECDSFRETNYCVPYSPEILPHAEVFLWKVFSAFGEYSLQYVAVISPVVFYILGLIVFFALVLVLTKSKIASILASGFLAFTPAYLYRTMAGFADHEAIGMFAFFCGMLVFFLGLKYHDKNLKWSFGLGLLAGLTSVFTIASWGGIAKFIFMIFPLAFLIYWIVNKQNLKGILFYSSWFISSILFGIFAGFNVLTKYIFSSSGLLASFVFAFIIIDYILVKKNFKKVNKKYRVFYSFIIILILGLLFLVLSGNLFDTLSDIFHRLLHPFGTSRLGLTVAENKQPYLGDWINQTGKILFWLFFGGLILFGINFSRFVKKKKHQIGFSLLWVLMIFGIIFSRISPNSLILNGTSFLSILFYVLPIIGLFIYSLWLYLNKKIEKINNAEIFVFSWTIFMLIAARGAARLFFAITPFVVFMAGWFIILVYKKLKDSKDDVLKVILGALLIIAIIATLFSLNTNVAVISSQAQYTGPSANAQWQKAMSWVKENTSEEDIFAHWWDYGYWVQYLGERPTISDGGHFQGILNHYFGRYVLTTPNPDSAMSLLKTRNVSYLLIDQTDLGKYGAYSSIGDSEEVSDRASQIPIAIKNPQQTIEKNSSVTYFYQGGTYIDQDIRYNDILLPKGKAVFAGVLLEIGEDLKQPNVIFIYNNQQYEVPLKNVYYNNELFEFEEGIENTIILIPSVGQSQQGLSIDRIGALIYLSERTQDSLFAQLYLMNDPQDLYPFELAHAQDSPVISGLQEQGAPVEEFVYYQGFRGPIKIWETNYPEEILTHEEFYQKNLPEDAKYGGLDDLKFRG